MLTIHIHPFNLQKDVHMEIFKIVFWEGKTFWRILSNFKFFISPFYSIMALRPLFPLIINEKKLICQMQW